MKFLDEAVITTVSGDGGKGCVGFRRERFIPKGGPDGGDGGNGGGVIIRAFRGLHTLADFSSKRYFKSQNGRPGGGKNQSGKNGKDTIIKVPVGTVVYDDDTGEMLADLVRDSQEIFIAAGGKGGKGNSHFATSTNRAPKFAQPGLCGQKKRLRLSLKYIADVGIIGLPNAGKSTLLSRLTAARPRIGKYPFTSMTPNLGVIEFEDSSSLTIADVPGLIEGASEGRGLGHRFLKHVERTKYLLHLIDVSDVSIEHPLKNFKLLNEELEKYDPALKDKAQLVLINKIDLLPSGRADVEKIRSALAETGFDSLSISALTGEGLEDLKRVLSVALQNGRYGKEFRNNRQD